MHNHFSYIRKLKDKLEHSNIYVVFSRSLLGWGMLLREIDAYSTFKLLRGNTEIEASTPQPYQHPHVEILHQIRQKLLAET